jgi:hypothetical protein
LAALALATIGVVTATAPAPADDLQVIRTLAVVQKASLDVILARQRVLDRSLFPRLSWQTAVFGRGSGANADVAIVR